MPNQGPRIAVEDWWLRLARQLVKSYPDGLVVLGRDLAKEIGRTRPWSHSTLSNFANKKIGATRDLQNAICQRFNLPPPMLFPRTYAEAAQMLGVKERHDRLIADSGSDAEPDGDAPPVPFKPRTHPERVEQKTSPRSQDTHTHTRAKRTARR